MTAEASGGHLHGPDALQNSVAACLGAGPSYLSSSRGGETGAPEQAHSPRCMCAERKHACGERVQTSSRYLGRRGASWSARTLLHRLELRTRVQGVGVRYGRQQQTLSAWTRCIALTRAVHCSLQVRCLVQHQPGGADLASYANAKGTQPIRPRSPDLLLATLLASSLQKSWSEQLAQG